MHYFAKFVPEDGGNVITFPDLPEIVTEGDSMDEALDMASKALELALVIYIDKGEPLPRARGMRGKDVHRVDVSAAAATKFALYSLFRESGIRKTELARRMGIPKSNVDRLFDIHRNTTLNLLESAFRALGRRLKIDVEEAA